jgi:hypothetical protein
MTTSIPSFAQPSKVFAIVEIQRYKVLYVPPKNVQMSTNKKLELYLTNQSQSTLSLHNAKSLLRNKALQQQPYNIVNKSESSKRKAKRMESTIHQQLLKKENKKVGQCIVKRKACLQPKKCNKKKEFSIAEKEFQKQITIVPVFGCR